MRNEVILKTWFFIVLLFLFSSTGFTHNNKFVISIKSSFYSPSSSTFNKQALPPTNKELDFIASTLNALGITPEHKELDQIHGEFSFGGELEIVFWKKFSLSIGAESWKCSTSGMVKFVGNVGDSFSSIAREVYLDASILPVYFTLKYNSKYKNIILYTGIGVGYYKCKMKLSSYSKWWQSYSSRVENIEAHGNSIIPHLNLGIDINVINFFSIALELRYLFGKIEYFEITKGPDQELISKRLTFSDENGILKPFKWELTGPSIGILFRFKF